MLAFLDLFLLPRGYKATILDGYCCGPPLSANGSTLPPGQYTRIASAKPPAFKSMRSSQCNYLPFVFSQSILQLAIHVAFNVCNSTSPFCCSGWLYHQLDVSCILFEFVSIAEQELCTVSLCVSCLLSVCILLAKQAYPCLECSKTLQLQENLEK